MITRRLTALLTLLPVVWFALPLAAADPEKSVVQILNYSQSPAWDAPWRFDQIRRSSGTGMLIGKKRILTNAHVTSWARQLIVKRYQDPHQYAARVVFVGHDCDLAVLEVDDPAFYQGLEPLEFGGLPPVRSTVVTIGYPAGGEQISYTKGVVSRIDMQNYVHIGNRMLLCVQTDAAINPGNSGGPVIQDDHVVGVAFQGVQGLENTGYFIPTPVIQHFLKDVEDGIYDGFPTAGIRTTALQNPAYRRMLKLPDDDVGARIDSVLPIPVTEKLIQEDDVLLAVGNYPVGSDNTIVYEHNRVNLAAAIQSAQSGETLDLKIWRQGAVTNIALPASVYAGDRVAGNQYDVSPRYFVYGGLVFTPLSLDYVRTFGRNWSDAATGELIYELFYRRNEDPAHTRSEPIVLASVLPHPVNANFSSKGRALVDRINGIRIDKLEDVIRAFQSPAGKQQVIELMPHDTIECLDVAESEKANPEILKTYGIRSDRRLTTSAAKTEGAN